MSIGAASTGVEQYRQCTTSPYNRRMANDVVAQAPGRVNLLGDHTDYNDSFVLPLALPFTTIISATPRADNEVHLISAGYGTTAFSLTDDPSTVDSWARYVAAMAHLLTREGIKTSGFDASITTNIPIGAGLSSSAALEVAAGYAIAGLAGIEPDPDPLPLLGAHSYRVAPRSAGDHHGHDDSP